MKTKILYIDDELSWRSVVGLFLKLAGFEMITVKDSAGAMLYSGEDDLGAIILDVNLAGEDTSALLYALKSANPSVPIVLYTGLEEQAPAPQRLLEQGARQYLRKGNLQDLVGCIQRIVAPDDTSRRQLQPVLQTADTWQFVK